MAGGGRGGMVGGKSQESSGVVDDDVWLLYILEDGPEREDRRSTCTLVVNARANEAHPACAMESVGHGAAQAVAGDDRRRRSAGRRMCTSRVCVCGQVRTVNARLARRAEESVPPTYAFGPSACGCRSGSVDIPDSPPRD
jgi:hypothetical protein